MINFNSILATTTVAALYMVSGVHAGLGSWYQPNGGYGACGKQLYNNDNVVALPPALWDSKRNCHRKVLLEYGGKKIVSTVEDLCPSCHKDKIDLTEGLFKRFNSTDVGILYNLNWMIL